MLMCEENPNKTNLRTLKQELESKHEFLKEEYAELLSNSAPKEQIEEIKECIADIQLKAATFREAFNATYNEIKDIVHEAIPELYMVRRMEKYDTDTDLILKKILCEGTDFERNTVARLLVMRGEVQVGEDQFFADFLKEHHQISTELESAVIGQENRHKIFPVMLECLKSSDSYIVQNALRYLLLDPASIPSIVDDAAKAVFNTDLHDDTRTDCYKYLKKEMSDKANKEKFESLQLELIVKGMDSEGVRADFNSLDHKSSFKRVLDRIRSSEPVSESFIYFTPSAARGKMFYQLSLCSALYDRHQTEPDCHVRYAINATFDLLGYKGPLKVRLRNELIDVVRKIKDLASAIDFRDWR